MKTSYKYLLGAVAVIGAVMLYNKYGKKDIVAPSKAKVATDETAPVSEDANSEFLGFNRPKKISSSKSYWVSKESGKCPKGSTEVDKDWCYKKGNKIS